MLLRKQIKNCIGSAGALGLLLTGVNAQAEAWDADWIGIVYLWGAGISIDVADQSAGVDFDDLVDNLEAAFMGHMEAQGDKIGGFVDVAFVGVGSNESRTNFDLNTDNDTMAMDLAVVWSPGPEPFTGLETYAGMRYVSNDFHLVADPVAPALPTFEGGIDEGYYDGLIGVRYVAPVSDNWRLTLAGRPVVRPNRGNLQPRRVCRLRHGPASLHRRLQALRDGPGIARRGRPDGDHVGSGARLRIPLLNSAFLA